MKKQVALWLMLAICPLVQGQIQTEKFGRGLLFEGKDSTFFLKLGFRFQNLVEAEWNLEDYELRDPEVGVMIRRSRIKLDGWVHDPRVQYKLELAMTNRDMSGGGTREFSNTPNYVLDAWVAWDFYRNFSIQFGQGKLPGNRERVISSGDLQFVDRSRLNDRFNLDRDVGIQLKHEFNPFGDFQIKEIVAISQGEGRNVTAGYFGALDYTFRLEFLPFGNFGSKGDYVNSAIFREEKLKFSLGLTYDINERMVRERGQLGSWIIDDSGNYLGKRVDSFHADCMLKYKGWSMMAEYAQRDAEDGNSFVLDENGEEVGQYYTGNALNVQAGYMFAPGWEIAGRFTDVNPDAEVDNDEDQYTLCFSRYVVGHKLKFQTDVTWIDVHDSPIDGFMWRAQVDVHL